MTHESKQNSVSPVNNSINNNEEKSLALDWDNTVVSFHMNAQLLCFDKNGHLKEQYKNIYPEIKQIILSLINEPEKLRELLIKAHKAGVYTYVTTLSEQIDFYVEGYEIVSLKSSKREIQEDQIAIAYEEKTNSLSYRLIDKQGQLVTITLSEQGLEEFEKDLGPEGYKEFITAIQTKNLLILKKYKANILKITSQNGNTYPEPKNAPVDLLLSGKEAIATCLKILLEDVENVQWENIVKDIYLRDPVKFPLSVNQYYVMRNLLEESFPKKIHEIARVMTRFQQLIDTYNHVYPEFNSLLLGRRGIEIGFQILAADICETTLAIEWEKASDKLSLACSAVEDESKKEEIILNEITTNLKKLLCPELKFVFLTEASAKDQILEKHNIYCFVGEDGTLNYKMISGTGETVTDTIEYNFENEDDLYGYCTGGKNRRNDHPYQLVIEAIRIQDFETLEYYLFGIERLIKRKYSFYSQLNSDLISYLNSHNSNNKANNKVVKAPLRINFSEISALATSEAQVLEEKVTKKIIRTISCDYYASLYASFTENLNSYITAKNKQINRNEDDEQNKPVTAQELAVEKDLHHRLADEKSVPAIKKRTVLVDNEYANCMRLINSSENSFAIEATGGAHLWEFVDIALSAETLAEAALKIREKRGTCYAPIGVECGLGTNIAQYLSKYKKMPSFKLEKITQWMIHQAEKNNIDNFLALFNIMAEHVFESPDINTLTELNKLFANDKVYQLLISGNILELSFNKNYLNLYYIIRFLNEIVKNKNVVVEMNLEKLYRYYWSDQDSNSVPLLYSYLCQRPDFNHALPNIENFSSAVARINGEYIQYSKSDVGFAIVNQMILQSNRKGQTAFLEFALDYWSFLWRPNISPFENIEDVFHLPFTNVDVSKFLPVISERIHVLEQALEFKGPIDYTYYTFHGEASFRNEWTKKNPGEKAVLVMRTAKIDKDDYSHDDFFNLLLVYKGLFKKFEKLGAKTILDEKLENKSSPLMLSTDKPLHPLVIYLAANPKRIDSVELSKLESGLHCFLRDKETFNRCIEKISSGSLSPEQLITQVQALAVNKLKEEDEKAILLTKKFGECGDEVKFPPNEKEIDKLYKNFGEVKKLSMTYLEFDENKLKSFALQKRENIYSTEYGIDLELVALIRISFWKATGRLPNVMQMLNFMTLVSKPDEHDIKGKLAQIKTGEGKSVINAMVAAYFALQSPKGKRIDYITTHEILAERDAKELAPFYDQLGLKVSHYSPESSNSVSADVMYATLHNLACIYIAKPDTEYHGYVLDEADSVLDSLSTMTIAGTNQIKYRGEFLHELWNEMQKNCPEEEEITDFNGYTNVYMLAEGENLPKIDKEVIVLQKNGQEITAHWNHNNKIVKKTLHLNDADFVSLLQTFSDKNQNIDNKEFAKNIALLFGCMRYNFKKLMADCAKNAGEELEDDEIVNLTSSWLQAKYHLCPDKHYKILYKPKKEIKIVDNFYSGEIRENLRWKEGLHSFLYAKHHKDMNVPVPHDMLDYLVINHHQILNLYHKENKCSKIAGTTGTLGSSSVRNFFKKHFSFAGYDSARYNLSQLDIRPLQIVDDVLTLEQKQSADQRKQTVETQNFDKFHLAILNNTEKFTERGQPVLVFVPDIASTKKYKRMMQEKFPDYQINILDGTQTEPERNKIIQRAGKPGVITIVTNIGGRGLDIPVSDSAEEKGGLAVVVTHLPTNERQLHQLFGRTGRFGNKGVCEFILPEYEIRKLAKQCGIKILTNEEINTQAAQIHSEVEKYRSQYFQGIVDKIFDHNNANTLNENDINYYNSRLECQNYFLTRIPKSIALRCQKIWMNVFKKFEKVLANDVKTPKKILIIKCLINFVETILQTMKDGLSEQEQNYLREEKNRLSCELESHQNIPSFVPHTMSLSADQSEVKAEKNSEILRKIKSFLDSPEAIQSTTPLINFNDENESPILLPSVQKKISEFYSSSHTHLFFDPQPLKGNFAFPDEEHQEVNFHCDLTP